MSSRAKGDRAEERFARILSDMGYLAHVTVRAPARRKPGGGWYSTGAHDILGLWDIVAKKEGMPTVWVQTTYESGVSERRKKLRAESNRFTPGIDECILAAWCPPEKRGGRGKFKLYRAVDDYLKGDGHEMKTGDRNFPWDLAETPTKQSKLT